jgi:hypothetical protein
MKRVGKEYPKPRVCEGRRKLWLRDDLDAAILPPEFGQSLAALISRTMARPPTREASPPERRQCCAQ